MYAFLGAIGCLVGGREKCFVILVGERLTVGSREFEVILLLYSYTSTYSSTSISFIQEYIQPKATTDESGNLTTYPVR